MEFLDFLLTLQRSKRVKVRISFFAILSFFVLSPVSFAGLDEGHILELKKSLQKDLKSNYLPKLIDQFGSCDEDDPLDCLNQKGDVVTFKTADREICFPYTECGFYKCMEQQHQCKSAGHNYFTDLAYPTCQKYVSNIFKNKFSKQGIEWVYTVMTCLQKGLIDECELDEQCPKNSQDRERTCQHITDFTLEYHPGCYIKSGPGVCNLPMKDKLNIWKTVGPYLTRRERKQAYRVIFYCLFR